MNLYCNSFRIWLLPILFCVLCGNLRAQEWLTVEDGNTSSPYYTFETIQQVPIDISTYGFQRGQSYAFLPQGVSTNHPFMIGEHNGDLNSSLLSVVGGGTVTPLTYNTSNLMITIPSNYSGNLVYFSTTDTSVHYYLSIVDPPGGNYQSSGGGYQSGGGGYQSPGSSYQPVYDLNASHLTNLSVQVNQSLAGKYSFFNRTNSSGSPEIRLELMEVATGQWQPQGIASSLYYLAKPDLFPSIPHIYDYLTSINLSPVNGYKPPGVNYQSSGSGYSSPPIYETTATLLVNNQPTSITGIPRAGPGSTWYQSFTAENSAKLTKFAFVTNGSFSATADVKIREGEGITGNILHSGTWSGLGSNANNFNEYEITNEVLLASGQQYTIQLENQTAGGFIGSNPGQYSGGMFYYSGYSGEYGDLKMKIWGLLEATGNAIEIISPATNDQNVTDINDTLTISYNYQSNAGGYQTPTWAYRIDSGFPGYGSPHGGTQVTGSRIKNNFLNGQTYGNKTVYVALLDPAGNLHNPPVTQSISVNYQTPTSGYQSSTGGTIAISSPSNSAGVNATNDNLQVTVTYTSPSGGYQTPTWAYRIDSGFPGYGSPHGGTQVTGNQANDFLNGLAYGTRQVNVALLDSAGNLHNPPVTQSISVNYQTPASGYQSDSGNYQSSGGDYQSSGSGWSINPTTYQNSMTMTAFVSIDGSSKGSGSLAAFAGSQIRGLQSNLSFPPFGPHQGQGLFQIMIYGEIDSTPLQFKWSADGTEANAISVSRQDGISISFENNGNQGSVMSPVSLLGTSQPNNSYQTPSSGYQTPSGGNQSPGGGYQTPSGGYQTPSGGNQSPGGGYQTPSGGYQTPSGGNQSPSGGYQTPSGGYQTPSGGNQSPSGGYQTPSSGYQTPTSGYQSDSGNYQSSGGDYQSSGSGWSINPATYQNSMTMTAFVSIDGSSKGSGSLAAFAGSQIRGLQSNLSFPTFGPHQGQGLFQIMIYGEIDSTPLQFKWSADGTEANAISVSRQDGISISFENNGNQGSVMSPVSLLGTSQPNNSYQTPSSGYQTPSGGNQSPGGGYQTPSGGYQTPSGGNQSPGGGYQTPSGGYQTPSGGNQSPSGGYQTPSGGYQTPSGGNQSPSGGYQTPSSGYQTPASGYQSDSGNYQSSGGDYQSSGSGWSINPTTYQNSMTMTAFVSIDGSSKGSGSLAAFAGSQIRGLQSNLSFPPFGPHQGQGLFQIMIYGEIDSTPLQFKWSADGTEANAISVSRQDGISISFENNGNQGSVMSPVSLLGTSQPNNSYQSDSGNYQSSGGDYQSSGSGWNINPATYQNSMTMTAFVSIDGSSKGSGSLAAFAGSQIRGLQSNLSFPTFGPHQGQGLFQIMIYGEIDSTPLQFKWSTDGTEANAISVSRQDGISISFENNGNQGSVISPVSLLGTSQPDNSYQSDSGNYQSSGGDYQSDSDGYQSPDSDYQDPAGVQAEENTPFTVTVFVTTIGFQSNVNEVTLSGEILHKSESDYTNIKVGFLISPSAEIMESDPLTYKVSGFFESADLFSANYTPSSNGVLYFKAFAENESGVSYGNIRKISNNVISNTQNQTPTEKAISTLEKDSIELPGGWRDNSWFGLYKAYENGWIYHSAHGWLYLSADSSDGIWAWSEKRSWVWSSKEIYPFLYQPSIGNWIYFLTSKNGQVYFFNYSTNLVEVNIP